MARKTAQDQTEYVVQTEEDLKSVPPMSGMQKGVLALAGVFVLAILAYIFIF